MLNEQQFHLDRYTTGGNIPVGLKYIFPGSGLARNYHSHDFSELAIIIRGNPVHLAGKMKYQLSPGDVMLIHWHNIHAYENISDTEMLNILYDPNRLSAISRDMENMALYQKMMQTDLSGSDENCLKPVLHLNQNELTDVLKLCDVFARELRGLLPGWRCGAILKFNEILLLLSRFSANPPACRRNIAAIDIALDHIHRNLNKLLLVRDLARLVNMSERNFFRNFRNIVGVNPNNYVCRCRMEYVSSQLRYTDLPVGVIAVQSGCYDGSDLYRKFMSHFGISPREFRRKYGGRPTDLPHASRKTQKTIPIDAS